MKSLNKKNTRIFCQLLEVLALCPDKSDDEYSMVIHCPGLPSIEFRYLSRTIESEFGSGSLFCLSDLDYQKGSPVLDRKMFFIVVDNRKENKQYEHISIYPQLYEDIAGNYYESICIDVSKIHSINNTLLLTNHSIVSEWLQLINTMQYLH